MIHAPVLQLTDKLLREDNELITCGLLFGKIPEKIQEAPKTIHFNYSQRIISLGQI